MGNLVCGNCSGRADAFTFMPGVRFPIGGWFHWDGHGVAVRVGNLCRKLQENVQDAIAFWNAAQGRFYFTEEFDMSLPSVVVDEYEDGDLSGPLRDWPDPAYWRSIGGAAILRNAAGEMVHDPATADRRIVGGRVWLRASVWTGGKKDVETSDAVRHELGHILGLRDIASDPSWRIMDYSDVFLAGASGPTPADVHSVLSTYGDISWWPAPEEYLADLPAGIVIWYVDPVTHGWVKWDSTAFDNGDTYINTMKGVRHGSLMYVFSEIEASFRVGRAEVWIPKAPAPNGAAFVWPHP